MALEGDLKEFSVPEVLQFVALHEGDGILVLTNKGDKITFGIKGGKIVAALYGKRGTPQPLEEYIIKSGRITKKELKEFKARAEELDISLDELLKNEGIIDEREIKSVIQFKIQEIVDEALTWKDGTYKFQPGKEIYPNSKVRVALEPNALVMEGMRRIDEWQRIQVVLPDEEIKLWRREEAKINVELGEEEKRILEIHKDGMKVKEYIEKSALGKFRTYNALFNLIEMGLLTKEPPLEEEEEEEEEEIIRPSIWTKLKISFEAFTNFLEYLIFLGLIGGSVYYLIVKKIPFLIELIKKYIIL